MCAFCWILSHSLEKYQMQQSCGEVYFEKRCILFKFIGLTEALYESERFCLQSGFLWLSPEYVSLGFHTLFLGQYVQMSICTNTTVV